MNRTYAPEFAPLVSNRYTDPQQTFAKANDVYAKGACVLHMLRKVMGDEKFFLLMKTYVETYRNKTTTVDDFRRLASEIHGADLSWFFAQWIDRALVTNADEAEAVYAVGLKD